MTLLAKAQDAPNISDLQNETIFNSLPIPSPNRIESLSVEAFTKAFSPEQQTNQFYLKPGYSLVHSFQTQSSTDNYGGSMGAIFDQKFIWNLVSLQPDLNVVNGTSKN